MTEFHVLTNICYIVVASYENKTYAALGLIQLAAGSSLNMASMLNTQGTSESLAEPFNLGPYIFVMDFSKPVNSNQNSIDISTDNITTAIRLPSSFYDGALFISDGVMYMIPGDNRFLFSENTTNFTNTVWNFNLKTRELDVQDLGQGHAQEAAIAFDTEKQVGWYYGGVVGSNDGPYSYSQDLYRLDRGKWTPTKVDVNSSSVGSVVGGELVYIKNIGEAGVLVLIGGATRGEKMVSMDLN